MRCILDELSRFRRQRNHTSIVLRVRPPGQVQRTADDHSTGGPGYRTAPGSYQLSAASLNTCAPCGRGNSVLYSPHKSNTFAFDMVVVFVSSKPFRLFELATSSCGV